MPLASDTLQQLVASLTESDYGINLGVLQTAHSIFRRWRAAFRSDALYSEINFVLSRFAEPYLALLKVRRPKAVTAQCAAVPRPDCCPVSFLSANFVAHRCASHQPINTGKRDSHDRAIIRLASAALLRLERTGLAAFHRRQHGGHLRRAWSMAQFLKTRARG